MTSTRSKEPLREAEFSENCDRGGTCRDIVDSTTRLASFRKVLSLSVLVNRRRLAVGEKFSKLHRLAQRFDTYSFEPRLAAAAAATAAAVGVVATPPLLQPTSPPSPSRPFSQNGRAFQE